MNQIPVLRPTRTKSTPLRKVFSQQDLEYMTLNHKNTSAKDMAKALGFSVYLIYMKLKDYDMKPYCPPRRMQYNSHSKEKIAQVLEDYCTTFDAMTVIGYRHNISVYTITQWISRHILSKKLNENTEILVLKSKV